MIAIRLVLPCNRSTGRKPNGMTAGMRHAALMMGASMASITFAAPPVALTSASSQPTLLTPVGSRVFFAAWDEDHGRELWVTDGTVAGTYLVKDILAGPDGSNPRQLQSQGHRVWFMALNATSILEVEPVVSDGSVAGTYSVRPSPTNVSVGLSRPQILAAHDHGLFWSTAEQLWQSDGAPPGTIMLQPHLKVTSMVEAGGILYFAGDSDSVQNGIGQSDGTTDFTFWLATASPESGYLDSLTAADSHLFFVFDSSNPGLWAMNIHGKQMAIEVLPQPPQQHDLGARFLTALGSLLIFSFDDSVNGRELWKSDGTPAGTAILADIADGPSSGNPEFLTVAGNGVYFVARENSTGAELWKTDGKKKGTVRLTDLRAGEGGSFPTLLVPAPFDDGVLFAATTPDRGTELWWSSGAPDSAEPLPEVIDGPTGSDPRELTVAGLSLFFVAMDADGANRLWTLDLAAPRHFRWLPDCLDGPGSDASDECSASFDADGDGDVDLFDTGAFLNRVAAN